ncbi:tRNA1(Val) (adenine(37)-N6)-methyltransferase [Alteromonas halophila]|nr:methyltransferase [Alteromonas halophila]
MKVNTDSLILGSWAQVGDERRILDVGTGSGILSLMLMQRAAPDTRIDAIDIDAKAVAQAADNFRQSPWADNLRALRADLTSWQPHPRYSLIISNPPYFSAPSAHTNAYREQSQRRQDARQSRTLSPASLLHFAARYLTDGGRLYCLYPYQQSDAVVAQAKDAGLRPGPRLDIRHNQVSQPYVSALCFTAAQDCKERQMLTIRDRKGAYTEEFRSLCQPYYLNF